MEASNLSFFSQSPLPSPRRPNPTFQYCPLCSGSKSRGLEPLGAMGHVGEKSSKEAKLWGGRFEECVTEKVEKFTESISFYKLLYKHDIMGSKAHAAMLAKQTMEAIDNVKRQGG